MNNFFKKIFNSSASSSEALVLQLVWLKASESLDDVGALNLATKHLTTWLSDDTHPLNKRIEALSTIDTQILPRAEKLAAQYAKAGALRPELETSIMNAAFNYSRQSYLNYLRLVELVIDAPATATLEHNTLLVIIAKAIDFAITMIKWRYFEHATAPASVWLQIYMLFEIAQRTELLEVPITVFSHSKPTTIAAYIAQISLLGKLEKANMQKQHYQTSAYLLKTWLNEVSFSNQYNKALHLFFIDLKKDACANRTRHFEQTNSCYFWHIDNFEAKVISSFALAEQGQLSDNLALAQIVDIKSLRETLQIMRSDWSKTEYVRQRRKESRLDTKQSASIAYGILDICDQVEHYARKKINVSLNITPSNKSLDEKLSSHTSIRRDASENSLVLEPQHEVWVIKDMSQKGLGAIAPKQSKSWVKPEKLIGMAMDERPPRVIIALVRGIMPTRDLNKIHVGVEVIARFATWGRMRAIEGPVNPEPVDLFAPLAGSNAIAMGFTALYLPIEAGLSEESTLILPKVEYRANEIYEVTINDTTQLIKLGSPIEAKDDWVRVAFPHIPNQ